MTDIIFKPIVVGQVNGPPINDIQDQNSLPVLMLNKRNADLIPPLPEPHKYGISEQQRKEENFYLCALTDKPPIEYVAEFLCNVFLYNKNKQTGEEYFYDGMGRTFYETILAMFKSNQCNNDKLSQLRAKFKYRAYNSHGDYAVFGSNHVTNDEMREFIKFFYNYFQENDDMHFCYFMFHRYNRSHKNKPYPSVMLEFMK